MSFEVDYSIVECLGIVARPVGSANVSLDAEFVCILRLVLYMFLVTNHDVD
jgi:hypothetical protein